jgi:hypothetical protein
MRLIDADRLKEALHEDCMTAMNTIDENTLNLLMIEIDEIPTVYDVNSVLEKLGDLRDTTINTEYAPCETYGTSCVDKAIEIVKGGGQGE